MLVHKLTKDNESLISFDDDITEILKKHDKYNFSYNVKPYIDRKHSGCVFLSYGDMHNYAAYWTNIILIYNNSDSFATILNNLKMYYYNELEKKKNKDNYKLYLKYNPKFFASVLHKLRKHDLAKKVEEGLEKIDLFDLFDDVADNYNKNYFADKFKEFESAYNDVLANW